jgi:hypothetical protein
MPDELDLFSGTRNLHSQHWPRPISCRSSDRAPVARVREAESQSIVDLMHELQLLLDGVKGRDGRPQVAGAISL